MEKTEVQYYGTNGYVRYAGVHLVIELWQAENLDNIEAIDRILRRAVADCGATLLDMRLHRFTPNGGISGVGVLQESHISIHTWPELEYAALDLFVCGTLDPYEALPAIKAGFKPGKLQLTELKRGILE